MNNHITWSPGVSLENIEKQVIQMAFKHFRENKTQTSIALGISVRTLDTKLELYAKEQQEHDERTAELRQRESEFQARSRGVSAAQPNGQHISTPFQPGKTYDESGTPMLRSQAGNGMESTSESSQEHAVSMSKRQEVQGLSSKRTASGGSRGHR